MIQHSLQSATGDQFLGDARESCAQIVPLNRNFGLGIDPCERLACVDNREQRILRSSALAVPLGDLKRLSRQQQFVVAAVLRVSKYKLAALAVNVTNLDWFVGMPLVAMNFAASTPG
jgi:hypothetical protein